MENEIEGEFGIEEIFASDTKAIEWLEGIKDTNFNNTFKILYRYAKECLKELSTKDLSEDIEPKEKKKIIENVRKYLGKQEEFRKKCLIDSSHSGVETEQEDFKLELFTEDEIQWIQNLTNEDIEKLSSESMETIPNQENIISKLRKANRFYNMQLKLAHTARIVRVAEEELKQFAGNLNEDLKEIVLISALLHDIGRFYQAKEQDDFNDRKLVINEEKNIKGHSKAGYYYSMMDLFRMNFFGDITDKDLLTRTIASFVVSYHGQSNDELEKNGIQVNQDALNELISKNFFDEEGQEIKALNALIKKAYSNAEFIQFDENSEKQKEFMKKFMVQMMLQKGVDTFEALGFEETKIEKIVENISESLEDNFVIRLNTIFSDSKNTEQQNKNIEELSQDLSEAISQRTHIQFASEDIQKSLVNMVNYDVAQSIYSMFRGETTQEEKRFLCTLFAFPTTIVTDADKVDILNQLASGTYPINYNPSKYKVFNKDNSYIEVEKEEAFSRYLSGDDEKELVLLKDDVKNFHKYNGMAITDNISPLRSALWLMNQFIFTNMKNKGSLVLIRDNKFIENTYKQFSEDENVKKILKPYMAYTLFYLNYIVDKENNSYTPDIMQKFCEEAYAIYQENDKLKEKYEGILEENLRENIIITTQEIGKATIDVPITEKQKAQQVENNESIRENINKGEETIDDN